MKSEDNKKIGHIWTIVCTSHSIDKESNNVSLYNVTEQLNYSISVKESMKAAKSDVRKEIVKGVMVPTNIQFATLWQRKESKEYPEIKKKAKIEFVSPEGKVMLKIDGTIFFRKGFRRVRSFVGTDRLVISGSGDYKFRLSIEDTPRKFIQVTEIPIDIRVNFTD